MHYRVANLDSKIVSLQWQYINELSREGHDKANFFRLIKYESQEKLPNSSYQCIPKSNYQQILDRGNKLSGPKDEQINSKGKR
jgi:hypothetical protein